MKIGITGHRNQRLNLPEDENDSAWRPIKRWLILELNIFKELCTLSNEPLELYCGMASGSDVVFALVGRLLKLRYSDNVKLHCVLPCKDYNSTHAYFDYIKSKSDEWVELSDKFYKGCDNVRDQYIVDHADIIFAIWDGNKSGGVWSTIRKAQKAGKKIIYCPKELIDSGFEN